jgi:hypothetical protein
MQMELDYLYRDAMMDLTQIAPAFSFLSGKGLAPTAGDYTPERFGNAELLMVGAPFSMRFQRDRGDLFVDAGSTSAGWHKLEYVLEFLDRSITQEQLGEPPNPDMMAKLLEQKWSDVADLFVDQRRISELHTFSNNKSAALMRRLFPKRK